MQKVWLQDKRGFSVVEAVITATIFVLLATAFTGAWIQGLQGNVSAGNRVRALFLADEGLEATRSIRDGAWANLVDGNKGLAVVGNKWQFGGVSDVSDIYTRVVNISSVDAQTKLVSSTVTWSERAGGTKKISLATYLTNWSKNSIGNWANPILYSGFDASGKNDGTNIAYKGDYIYLVRNGVIPNFLVYNLANPLVPVAGVTLTLAGTINDMMVSGNYLYLTSSNDTSELIILNITNPAAPSLLTNYDLSGNSDGHGVYVSGSYAFVTRQVAGDKEFNIINISNPAAPILTGAVDTTSLARDLVVMGNYAYLATADNNLELNVVNITNLAAPFLLPGFNISGGNNGYAIDGYGSTVFVGLNTGKISIINVANPSVPVESSLYALVGGKAVNAVHLGADGTYLFVGTSNPKLDFNVLDVSNVLAPVTLSSLNLSSNLNDLVYDPEKDLVYAASVSDTSELTVIAPQ